MARSGWAWGSLLAGGLWSATAALASLAYLYFDVTFAVWLPGGIAVASLIMLPRRQWLLVMALIATACLGINLLLGSPPAYMAAHFLCNLIPPVLTAALLRRMVRGTLVHDMPLGDLVRLTAAAFTGALPTIPAMALVMHAPFAYVAQYYLMFVLGTIIIVSMALSTRESFGRSGQRIQWRKVGWYTAIGSVITVLAYVVLGFAQLPLLFLVGAAIVITVARFGQVGASIGVFALGWAATLRSAGGISPIAYLDVPRGEGTLYLQCYMLALTAVSLPLAALLNEHNLLARKLAARNRELDHDMTVFALAETLAGIGRWRFDRVTGQYSLSPELKRIFGFPVDSDIGFAQLARTTPDQGRVFRALLASRRDSRNTWRRELTIRRPDGEVRVLKTIVMNEFNPDGTVRENIGVVLDVTEQHRREQALRQERARAMRLAAEANLLAQTDPLTGLANRRRTFAQLRKCTEAARDSGRVLSLVVFDIDHFKRINDGYGHQTGDDVLMRVANIARTQIREADLLGRIGGEEFVWLLADADMDVVGAAAERLCRAVERDSGTTVLPAVTVSVGHATFHDGDDAEALLARADAALYEAKRDGRNRVSVAA